MTWNSGLETGHIGRWKRDWLHKFRHPDLTYLIWAISISMEQDPSPKRKLFVAPSSRCRGHALATGAWSSACRLVETSRRATSCQPATKCRAAQQYLRQATTCLRRPSRPRQADWPRDAAGPRRAVRTPVPDVTRGAFYLVSDLTRIWCFGDTETDKFVCTSLVSGWRTQNILKSPFSYRYCKNICVRLRFIAKFQLC